MNKIEKLREVKKDIQEHIDKLETMLFIQNDSVRFDTPKKPNSQKTLIN